MASLTFLLCRCSSCHVTGCQLPDEDYVIRLQGRVVCSTFIWIPVIDSNVFFVVVVNHSKYLTSMAELLRSHTAKLNLPWVRLPAMPSVNVCAAFSSPDHPWKETLRQRFSLQITRGGLQRTLKVLIKSRVRGELRGTYKIILFGGISDCGYQSLIFFSRFW